MPEQAATRISVIIPVHNAAPYIAECLDSILSQSMTDWEALCVDDGSTDESLNVLRAYASKDSRIRVISQAQGGVSAARNVGLDRASGEFVAFVDADDYLPAGSLAARVEAIGDAELAVCGITLLEEERLHRTMPPVTHPVWDREETLLNIAVLGELGYQGYVFNKLFRRSIIEENHLRFAEGIAYNEDRLFCVSYALHCEKTALCDKEVYVYRRNEGGAMAALKGMTDASFDRCMSEFEAYDRMLALLKGTGAVYHLLCDDAWNRASIYLSLIPMREKRLRRASRRKERAYCLRVLLSPGSAIPFMRKVKVLAHTVL